MKRTFSTVAVVAMAMAAGAAAAGAGQEKIPELPRRGMTDVKSITLTGCVARGTATDSYTLTQASEGAAAASDATPRLPVALTGTDVDLNKHVGQSVSVSGSYANAEAAVGTAGTEKPTVPATIEGDKTTRQSFTVKSLTMIASSCMQASE
jgi:hypothetical protein